MEIVKLTKANYKEWDDFCLKSDDAWFWHTTDWLEYTLQYKPELETKNFNFLIYKQNKIKAIVPLTLEVRQREGEKINEFSFGGFAVPAPALANDLEKIEKDRTERDLVYDCVFAEIDRLAKENKVKRAWFRQTPLARSSLDKNFFNYLIKFGYLDVSLNTQLIDLNKSEAELWQDLRRNHRRNIKKGGQFKIAFYTAENITPQLFNAYKKTHHKAAGRKTRPDETFALMYQWLKNDLAFLVAAEYENKRIGFEYYGIYKNNVYGFSAANDPDYAHLPVRHAIEWEAIRWMKKKGISFYDIGLQQYGARFHDFPDKKQLDISHFKKGFGGFPVPWLMGEKFFDQSYFQDTYRQRIAKYAESII
ncbi:hypothetical protein COU00_02605 [Candidatus Falkowbacteria bacterium CG10_big_fil_rev_8_21_14_0_10_43_11]|uniref:BioF2-like acetyltransferase domain-containing protein n=1 Tax=Candidatus Falkowbacteria bacterium CG10_big_fil_rev_8_21_14_0_10_43_11 TaxID=1974568 RepID=A0A2M6WLW0_9BACT|nr:MAG: hypothetical protein COU00_02605 [Candidatus Falkowbacteria bacterium CG10_big_fil_rev_8_21_14_0_10_43_11]